MSTDQNVNRQDLRRRLVGLGVVLGIERYLGQGKTAGAHEFADRMMAVIDAVEDDIVRRVVAELKGEEAA